MYPNNGPQFNGPPGPQQGGGPNMQFGANQRPAGPQGQCGPPSTGPGPPGPGGGFNRVGPCGGPSGSFQGGQQGGPQFGGQGQCGPQQFGNSGNQGPRLGSPQQSFNGPQQSGGMGGPMKYGPCQGGPPNHSGGQRPNGPVGGPGANNMNSGYNGPAQNCPQGNQVQPGCNMQSPQCNQVPNYGQGGWNGPQNSSGSGQGPSQQWGQNGNRSQGSFSGPNFNQGNSNGPQGNMGGQQGYMGAQGDFNVPRGQPNGPQGNMNGPQGMNCSQGNMGGQGNFNGPQASVCGPQGNFNGPQGNFSGPQGNMNGPQGNMNGPQGNLNGPQGNVNRQMQGNMNGPSGNMSGPQGNMNGPQGSMSGPPGNMNRSQVNMNMNEPQGTGNIDRPPGNMNGPQGNMQDPQGNMNGPQGNVQGPQGNMKGPQGNMQGSRGNMSGPQGNMSGPQGKMQGPQGNMNGPQGNMNGPQGNMQGPQGNVNGPQGNMQGPCEGNMNGPQGNMNGPQGNTQGSQGNISGPQGNMQGPHEGNMNGPQGNMQGPQGNTDGPPGITNGQPGNLNGPQGNMKGPQGNMNGPQGNVQVVPQGNTNGPPGNMTGPQGNLNGPQGNMQGPQGNMNSSQGNMQGPQGNMDGPPGNMNGPQGNLNGPQGNMNGPQENVQGPQGNMNGPQSNMQGPQGNMNGPQGNISGPQGNVNGPQGNMQGNVNGPQGNMNGPQGGMNGPQENMNSSQGNMQGPQGNMDGPQGNMNGPQGNMNGPQGNMIGPQGNMNGPQGNVNGPQGNVNGPQGNMNGPQGSMNSPWGNMQGNINGPGPQGNMNGPQGNMNGPQGNMNGPPPRPQCPGQQEEPYHPNQNNGPQQNFSGQSNQGPRMDGSGAAWGNNQGAMGQQGPNWGNQGVQGPNQMGPSGCQPNQSQGPPNFQGPPCDGPLGPRGPPPGCDGPAPQGNYEQPPGPRGVPPGCDGPPPSNHPHPGPNMQAGPQQYDGPLGPRGPPPGSDGPQSNWNPVPPEQRIPPPGYDGPPGPRGPPPGSDGPPPSFEDPQRNWGPPGPNGSNDGPGSWPPQNNMGHGPGRRNNQPPNWDGPGAFQSGGRDERPPPPGCDQERDQGPNQPWQGGRVYNNGGQNDNVFDRPMNGPHDQNVDMPTPRERSPVMDGIDHFYREDDFDIDITRLGCSPERERRRTSPNWNRDLAPRERLHRSPPRREWRGGNGNNDWSLPPPRRDSPPRGIRRPPLRRPHRTSPESPLRRDSPRGPRNTSPNWRESGPFLERRRSLSPIPRRRISPETGREKDRPNLEEKTKDAKMDDGSYWTEGKDAEKEDSGAAGDSRPRGRTRDRSVQPGSPRSSRRSDKICSPQGLSRRLSPPLGRTLSPPLARRLSPPLGRTLSPPLRRKLSPPLGRTLDPPLRRALSPPLGRHRTPPLGRILSPPLRASSCKPRRRESAMPGGRIVQRKSPERRTGSRYFQIQNEETRSRSVDRGKNSKSRNTDKRRGSDSTDRRAKRDPKVDGSGDARLERKRKRGAERDSEASRSSPERSRSSDPDRARSRSVDVRCKRSKKDSKVTGNDSSDPSAMKETLSATDTAAALEKDVEAINKPHKKRPDGKRFEVPKGQRADSKAEPNTRSDKAQEKTPADASKSQPEVAITSESQLLQVRSKDLSEKDADKAKRKSRETKKSRTSQPSDAQKTTEVAEDPASDGSFSYDPSPERCPVDEEEDDCVADPSWMRSSPADLYFRNDDKIGCVKGTKKMLNMEKKFQRDFVRRSEIALSKKPKYTPPERRTNVHLHCHHQGAGSGSESHSSSDSEDDELEPNWMDELNRKKEHPYRLHDDLWYNESGERKRRRRFGYWKAKYPYRLHHNLWFNMKGEMNDGPLCRCSIKARRSGIRHSIYPGESRVDNCDSCASNTKSLFHYRVTMSPHTNFLTKNPTVIDHDDHEYIFDGFSLFSHYELDHIPLCKVIRFNIEYTIHFFEEPMPMNFTTKSLDIFVDYLFSEVLELLDLDWYGQKNDETGCKRFHLMPRFVRSLPENGREILSMNEIISFLMKGSKLLVEPADLERIQKYEPHEWQDIVDSLRGMIVTHPGMKPSSIRVDQFDRHAGEYPVIVHFGIKPAQLSYAGDPNYQKLWKQYAKYKHLLANKPKVTPEDKMKLNDKEDQLQEIRMKSCMKREVTVEISGEGFIKTGIRSDMCQHALLLPVLISHLRFHRSLDVLERQIDYRFKDRNLLQRALTHPSYRVNYGTNPDHARNSLSNCGIRQPEFGDRKIHHVHSRKRGINTLINIMSRMGNKHETDSEIHHYERLEFLGDAVVEFVSSIHLFFMFPELDEGGLATFRAALVQNQHLAVLARTLHLQEYMLYAHGPDLCHDSDLKHAMANCLEALMGALFLDGGIELADRIFASTLFDDKDLHKVWENMPQHPLQDEEPCGDRHWIKASAVLKNLLRFEDMTGIEFTNIRLLARAFTPRNLGFNNLTLGHNQRLEFLGDTVLQLIASEYLFKHFPEHHEGHLSLLRSSLVNNRTQSVVCDDLGMTEFVSCHDDSKIKEMKMKEKADLLEAFIGSLYVDKGLDFCKVFAQVCFFPRLKVFIMNQEWNDPKSQLQQCCLTLRELDGGEPDIPIYKVLETTGPTNTRRFTVAVYFRGTRLATGSSHSIQQAEMNAATNALNNKSHLFPQLSHQKMFIEKKYHQAAKRSYSASEAQAKPP